METASTTTPPPALVRALTVLLRPLVRTLVAQGITFPYLSSMLKKVYVDVVDKDFALTGKKQTASRVSLVSGVHRKDVRRLLGEAQDETPAPKAASAGARLIAEWTGAPEYLDEEGKPRPLPRSAAVESGASFESLVESVKRQDIRPRAVLDDLEGRGVVSVDARGFVHLNSEAFVPRRDFDELAYYFGRNLRDHIAAAGHNLAGQAAPFPERAVYYGHLTTESVETLQSFSREVAMAALNKVNRRALELARSDDGRDDARKRMTLGFYYFAGDDAPGDDAKITPQRAREAKTARARGREAQGEQARADRVRGDEES